MKFNKTTVKVMTSEGIEEVNGYEFEYALADGRYVPMWVCKRGSWEVIDPNTGMSVCTGSKTREAAIKLADSMEVKPVFTNYIATAAYKELVDGYTIAKGGAAKDITEKENSMESRIAELEKQLAAAKAETKMWQAKAEEYYAAKKKAPAAPKAPAKAPAKPKAKAPKKRAKKPSNEVRLADLLVTMQEWCGSRPNTSAYRLNELAETAVRVVGETKPYEKELNELGFRWSRKGFWYYGPQQAERQGKKVVA